MRHILILAAAMLTLATACTPSETLVDSNGNKLTKEQRKQYEAMQDSITAARAHEALMAPDFVLEADKLVFKSGRPVYVTPNTNFVSIVGNQAVVQVAPFNSGGPNGVGGITLNGTTSDLKVKTDSRGNTTLSATVIGPIMSATINITLYGGSNEATVNVASNFRSTRITLSGRVVPTDESSVYKGNSI